MARSLLTNPSIDVIRDDGSVLWSLVMGEQLEFPVTLGFIMDATKQPSNNYQYEAVVIEALNEEGQVTKPFQVRENGAQTQLKVRLPNFLGEWEPMGAYNREDVVRYQGAYYRLAAGINYVSDVVPTANPLWLDTTLNRVYLQFPKELGSDWLVKPVVNSPVYGFFELRVTEPATYLFTRTWKPVRGMVELLFSPTDVVPDP